MVSNHTLLCYPVGHQFPWFKYYKNWDLSFCAINSFNKRPQPLLWMDQTGEGGLTIVHNIQTLMDFNL